MFDKIVSWFEEDIREQISWSDADVSDKRIKELAHEKTIKFMKEIGPERERLLMWIPGEEL